MLPLWMQAIALGPSCFCFDHPTARETWQSAEVVMTATVVRIDVPPAGTWEPYKVTVRANALLKWAKPEPTYSFRGGRRPCLQEFNEDEEWLLYLQRRDATGEWQVTRCNRSRKVSEAGADLMFLGALPESADRNRISGTVRLNGNPVQEMKIIARSGGKQWESPTGLRGTFEFLDLPPGSYEVQADAGPGFEVRPRVAGKPDGEGPGVVELTETGHAEVDLTLKHAGRISGRILDAAGVGVGHATVQLVGEARVAFTGESDSDGAFTFAELEEGRYRVVANPGGVVTAKDPFPATSFPGAGEELRLGMGDRAESLVIEVGPLAARVRIEGRVEFANGAPAEGGEVRLFRDGEPVASGRSASDGGFELVTLKGQEDGWLEIRSSDNCHGPRPSAKVRVQEGQTEGLVIRLDGDCAAHR